MDEQHGLMPAQVVRHPPKLDVYSDEVYYEYTEFISKNNQHRFKDINATNKNVRAYAKPESERCIVRLLDMYLSKLPTSPPAFYLRPLSASGPWYGKSRVGVNTLKKFIPDLCKSAALSAHYTNHSLRATAITRMYKSGVPEKVISEKSGHRSLKALRVYEHTSVHQQKLARASIVGECVDEASKIDLGYTSPEIKPDISTNAATTDNKPGTSQKMPCFTGLQNCTFNFYN